MPDALPEFVTVADAARILSMPLRTAQRHAAKLGAGDRQTGQNGASVVRLVALARSTGRAISSDPSARDSGAGGVPVDRHGAPGGAPTPADSVVQDGAQVALIDQLRAENARAQEDKARLFDALERAQETARGAVAELAELRREYNLLRAATQARRIAPNGIVDTAVIASDAPETGAGDSSPFATPPPGATPDPQPPASAGTGQDTPEPGTPGEGQNNRKTTATKKPGTGTLAVIPPPIRRWWQVWKKGND